MRKALLLLPLLLAGCVNDAATYSIDGNDHALTLRATQDYFWKDELTLYFTASRLPECQRRFPLPPAQTGAIDYELYSNGDNVWTLKMGKDAYSFETQTCAELEAPSQAPARLVGKFVLERDKLAFEEAKAAAAPAQ